MMRLVSLKIDRLFGMFDHLIELNQHPRITIIHGPNGIGKTTILRLIAFLFSNPLAELAGIPFSVLQVRFDDGSNLKVTRRRTKGKGGAEQARRTPPFQEDQMLRISYSKPGAIVKSFTYPRSPDKRIPRFPLIFVQRRVPWLERIGVEEWLDSRDGTRLSLEAVLERYGGRLQPWAEAYSAPGWFHELQSAVKVRLIETQRLLILPEQQERRRPETEVESRTVVRYSKDLVTRIQEALALSFGEAQSLDRTFPNRALNMPPSGPMVSEKKIRAMYEKQLTKSERLMQAGLLAEQQRLELPARELEPAEKALLLCYLQDSDKKLGLFDSLLERVELFKNMINSRFLFKAFSVDARQGFVFTATTGEQVPLTALSSGEQHELVIAYELLFRVAPGSLVLIDEPELSLHVTWQHRFLEDLARMSALVGLDFLVATHSPQIIHKHWDLAVMLESAET